MITPTQEQLKLTADKIIDTSRNIFRVADDVLGSGDYDHDKLYDDVCALGKIFKCEYCDVWTANDMQAGGLEDCCEVCDDERDEDDA